MRCDKKEKSVLKIGVVTQLEAGVISYKKVKIKKSALAPYFENVMLKGEAQPAASVPLYYF